MPTIELMAEIQILKGKNERLQIENEFIKSTLHKQAKEIARLALVEFDLQQEKAELVEIFMKNKKEYKGEGFIDFSINAAEYERFLQIRERKS